MIGKLAILACLAGFSAVAATAQELGRSAALFGAREGVQAVDISPDGSKIVYITPRPGPASAVLVNSLAGGEAIGVVGSDGNPNRLQWCAFLSDTRLVCRAAGSAMVEGLLVPYSRLTSIDIDGKNQQELGQRASAFDTGLRQFDGSIIDWLPDDGGAVLMSRDYVPEHRMATRIERRKAGLGVDRIDVRTLRVTAVEPARENVELYMTDGHGNVRIMGSRDKPGEDQQMKATVKYSYRKAGRSEWEDLGTHNSVSGEGLVPLAIDGTLNAAYVLRKLDGRQALYRVKLDGTMATELAYAHPTVDVDDVVRVGRGGKVIGVTYADDARRTIYFDSEYARLAASLSKAIPNLPLVRFTGASADNSKLLIHAGSDTDPGRYYVYDKARRALNEITLVRPELENATLGATRHITYPAVDGVRIPAYLTLPPGRDPRNLPAIVMPHGGPSARDELDFDWLTQFFVSQGYAVLRPNYRGSAGYGDAWMVRNGFRGWETSIGDVTSAGKWLISEGIANPSKLAIVGWSYGGYAALQSGVTEPGLFRAIVAVAPVTDLAQLKLDARGFTNARFVEEFVGSGPHVERGSPLQNVSRITAPVLMFHGDRDLNVAVIHSRNMDKELQRKGKRSELVIFPGLEHSLIDSKARTRLLERSASFLAEALGR